uniref:SAM domain-containing protein n=1 Tax=Angiostrongylus cantonensis TaxID=6313 RepID=A0A0K0CZS9_ANGCA
LRNSCPDLKIATALPSSSNNRVQRRRNRRAKEKMKEACWRRKPLEVNAFLLQEWALDDVVLWLQACNLDDVASLFIGYDLRGTDLLSWDHHCLCEFDGMVSDETRLFSSDDSFSHLGVTSASIREKILDELATIRERGPDDMRETEKRTGHRALFDIVKQSSYDQVLAVETPLTTRDIVVTHGRLCCLQITKVNGVNLPLRENDCLLEINDRPGEQFKSALMLTKLISDANGVPIRFVVLRMKTVDRVENGSNETSSSGVSSSPRSPSD